jgi:hypothetical protein
MELSTIPSGQICQWPNDYPVPGLDPDKENCDMPAAFLLTDHGYSARVCLTHGLAELMRS